MSNMIHPTAVVSPKATLGSNITIMAYAVVEDDVHIDDGATIMYHAVLMDGARIGAESKVYPGAVIGAPPQDFAYHGQKTVAVIGKRTTIRECVTVNRASHSDEVRIGVIIGIKILFAIKPG